MTTKPLDYNSKYFSVREIESCALVSLQPHALDLLTDLQIRQDYISLFSNVERSTELTGLVQINSLEYPGDDQYRDFLERIMGSGAESTYSSGLLVSRLRNSIAYLTLLAAKFSKPLVAGVKGTITGEYLGVMLPYDFRFATADVVFTFPNVKLGFPPSATLAFYLPRYVGQGKATEVLLSGKPLTSAQALELGIITAIVSDDQLEQRCLEKIRELSGIPAFALAATRGLLQPDPAELEAYFHRSFDSMWTTLVRMGKVDTPTWPYHL